MSQQVKLDWRGYFNEFCRAHGGEPLVYLADPDTGLGGYLLFPDGWMYSRSDYSGPEYAPLSAQDAQTKINHYWGHRRRILRQELTERLSALEDLVLKQDRYSASLIQRVEFFTEDEQGTRRLVQGAEAIDFGAQLDELRGLLAAYQECEQNLRESPAPPERPERQVAAHLAELNSIRQELSDGQL